MSSFHIRIPNLPNKFLLIQSVTQHPFICPRNSSSVETLGFFSFCSFWRVFSKVHQIMFYLVWVFPKPNKKHKFSIWTCINRFMLLVSFYTPWKHQKSFGLLIYSIDIKNDQWHEIVLRWNMFRFTKSPINSELVKKFLTKMNKFSHATLLLCEKYPNTEFFLVRIFLCLVQMKENTNQKKARIWTLFCRGSDPTLEHKATNNKTAFFKKSKWAWIQ